MIRRARLAAIFVVALTLTVACGGGAALPSTSSTGLPGGSSQLPAATPSASATPVTSHGTSAEDLQLGAPVVKVGMKGDATDPPPVFVPPDISVHVGDIVEWDYSATAFVPHNVVFDDAPELRSHILGQKPDGSPGAGTWQVRFTVPGTYRYRCTYHPPTMVGSVTVS